MGKKFDIFYFTMGTREYAKKIIHIIYGENDLDDKHILSREHSGESYSKSLKRLLPYDDNMVVIIDDREDVWSGSKNLVMIYPYVYFQGKDVNNSTMLNNQMYNAAEKSENLNNDCALYFFEILLEKIHAIFYSLYKGDVKLIIESIRSHALEGEKLVFSHMFELGKDPTKTYEWQAAQFLGAKCVNTDIIKKENVTKVVAKQFKTTKKMQLAKQNGISVVHTSWLYMSIKFWLNIDSLLFEIDSDKPVLNLSETLIKDYYTDEIKNNEINNTKLKVIQDIETNNMMAYNAELFESDESLRRLEETLISHYENET